MSLFVVLPTCLSTDPAPGTDVNWQNTLMDRFFDDIPTKHLLELSKGSFSENFPNNYCNGLWTPISCEGARITRIRYFNLRVGNFRLNELPPTLEDLWISACKQTGAFHTRNLPRALVTISLSRNKLSGKLDLTTLPEDLVQAHFCENHFTGPICLCHLPKSLKYLLVHANLIAQDFVWYDDLPPGIAVIQLQSNGQRKIGRVRALHAGKAVNARIFSGMQPSSIE